MKRHLRLVVNRTKQKPSKCNHEIFGQDYNKKRCSLCDDLDECLTENLIMKLEQEFEESENFPKVLGRLKALLFGIEVAVEKTRKLANRLNFPFYNRKK